MHKKCTASIIGSFYWYTLMNALYQQRKSQKSRADEKCSNNRNHCTELREWGVTAEITAQSW
jgi:hypothetical protein